MQDRRIIVREIVGQCGIDTARVHEILHDNLHLSKISAGWVLRLLETLQKRDRMDAYKELLAFEQSYGENYWRRIM